MATKVALEVVGKGVALAAFVFSASSYVYNLHVTRERQQYSEAMTLIDDYSKSGPRTYENQLNARLLYYRNGGIDLNDEADFPDELFEDVARETLFGFAGGTSDADITPFLDRFFEIADLYERVAFCIDARVCDEVIVLQYFCPRAERVAADHVRLIAYYTEYSGSEDWIDGLNRVNARCSAGA